MARVVLVSNRLPVAVQLDRGEPVVERSAGGVATGLRGLHDRSEGVWIGWPGDVSRLDAEQRAKLLSDLAERRCLPVYLTADEVTGYYDGFSNGVLWPLFHYLLDRIPPHSHEWDVYRAVNEKFADAVASAHRPGDLVWVHDYQLALVPQMLRVRVPGVRVGYFLHIPFPSTEVFRTLPWREPLLEGMLGADLLGFHTLRYQDHFSSSVHRILGIPTQGDTIRVEGREIRIGVFPIGVDAPTLSSLAEDADVANDVATIRAEARGERILLGIDRLDYTKGIPRRMLAFERLLEREPSWKGKVRLVQVAVPSRGDVASYQDFRSELDRLVGRINGAFSTVDWSPIRYVQRSMDEKRLVALYRAADVMLVTPLRDGMNLVAKEFVTCRSDQDGVLVLSEFAGAAAEMGEALQVNPYDIDAMAVAYHQALTMPEEERRVRMRALRQRVATHDVHQWAQGFIDALGGAAMEQERALVKLSSQADLDALASRLRGAEGVLLLLDYDGTLAPFVRVPELARPDAELWDLIKALAAKPGVRVHVVSGRPRETLERWLGNLPIGLHAEHGFWSRMTPSENWVALEDADVGWKGDVRRILDEARVGTPGALVEEKAASLAWHWRMADPDLGAARAQELWRRLEDRTQSLPVELLRGQSVIEVRPRGVNKGRVVDRVLAATERPLPTIVAIGDDWTDEDLFRALPPDSLTIGVGFRASGARYRVARPRDVRDLLARMLG